MERNCTILLHYDKNTPPNEDEIREELEHKEVDLAPHPHPHPSPAPAPAPAP